MVLETNLQPIYLRVPALTMTDQFKSGATHAPSVGGQKFILFTDMIDR